MAKHNNESRLILLPRRVSKEMKLLYLILGIQILTLIIYLVR